MMLENAYKGKHPKRYSRTVDKLTGMTTVKVYLPDGTLVIRTDRDGNITDDLEPI